MLTKLRGAAVPLRTLDPSDADMDDLEPVRDAVGDARVVCLGESAHGVPEFLRCKDRISRFLVQRLGFSSVVLESGFAEGLAVNDWVLGGTGTLDSIAADGVTYGFGHCSAVRDQLAWMREWNARGDGAVRFYGMDVPGSCANPVAAVRACLARLPAAHGDEGLLESADLGPRFRAPSHHEAMSQHERARLSRGIAELVERAETIDDDIARYCAMGAQQLDDQLNGGGYRREEVMADTVRWILEREDRIVISAQNGHVQRGTLPNGATALGALLAPVLGERLVVLGTTRSRGQMPDLHVDDRQPHKMSASVRDVGPPPPDTLDASLDDAATPPHFIDLREVSSTCLDGITGMCGQADTFDVDPLAAFDAVVHIGQVTADPDFWRYLLDATADA